MDFGAAINRSLIFSCFDCNNIHFHYKLYNLDYDHMLREFTLNKGKIPSYPLKLLPKRI